MMAEPRPSEAYSGWNNPWQSAITYSSVSYAGRSVLIAPIPSHDSRIKELRHLGEEEGIELSEHSVQCFSEFLRSGSGNFVIKTPSLVLLDNGNLRGEWLDENRLVGIQFCPKLLVTCVLLKNKRSKEIEHKTIEGSFKYVIDQIDAFGLKDLLHAQESFG